MRKDHLHRRSKDAEGTNDGEVDNGDPLSGSADPFDALINSKSDESTTSRSNGKRPPSPIADDSDAENDAETKNDDEKSEVNGDSAVESADNGDGGDEEGYEVEDIVDHKFKGKKKYFKIRWKNYDESADTWELEKDLSCPEIIERYVAEHPEANVVKEKKEKKVSKIQIFFVRPCRWHDFNQNEYGIPLKVRISLPPQTPTRAAPKRTVQRKAIVDDTLSDDEESDSKKSPSKRGRPKKNATKGSKSAKAEEYEVQKIVGDEIRNGKKFYKIRWKGWAPKYDTWEPKASLSCPDIIKSYENSKDEEYEVEKIVGEKVEFGVRSFLVKWKGWPESSNSWESAVDCFELIEKFRDSCRSAGKSTNKRAANTTPKASKAKKSRKNVSDDDDSGNENEDNDDSEKEWEGNRKYYKIFMSDYNPIFIELLYMFDFILIIFPHFFPKLKRLSTYERPKEERKNISFDGKAARHKMTHG